MNDLIWLIPLLPLIGFILNGFGRNVFSKSLINLIACGSVLISFVLSCLVFGEVWSAREAGEGAAFYVHLFDWIHVGDLKISFSFLVDPLSSIMLLIVTGIGFLIHLYSTGYMSKDPGYGKFFSYLNLFVFFMLLLVLGSNYLIMFIGWEGVGLCSYLLIGFWYKNNAFSSAGKKAFVMNRIGDLGFLLAAFFIIDTFGSLEFQEVFGKASHLALGGDTLFIITLLLFIAATGKSAQIPLFTWLPDAMAGPTPVSALIHAATMVTAGIYMIARSNILFVLSPMTMNIVAVVGLCTAFVAAFIALTQNDIKKVLAYSTVSQLGYMFLGLGIGAFTGAFFHVLTHAFFKALLFLGAGSVIHALADEQDMRAMGGLKKKLPITFATMLIATIAISGIPPLSGFFSKDEILLHAFTDSPLLWVVGIITALFTAFYMFRLLFMTFYGKYRGTAIQEEAIVESPKVMTVPLIVLAVLSIFGGLLNIPEMLGGGFLANFLAPVFADGAQIRPAAEFTHSTEIILMVVSAAGALLMAFFAYKKYVSKEREVSFADETKQGFLHNLSYGKLYVDEFYDAVVVKPLKAISQFFYTIVDKGGIDGVVRSVGKAATGSGKGLRKLQSGYLTFYVFMMVLGAVIVLLYGFLGN